MNRRTACIVALLCAALALPAQAQDPDARDTRTTAQPRDESAESPDRTEASSDETQETRQATFRERMAAAADRIRRAANLPKEAEDAREAGVPEEKVQEVIRTSRERQIPAGDVAEILDAETAHFRETGNAENFGAAVQAMKDRGLRGRELADAIHDEQIARGMKKPKAGNDRGMGKGKGKGKGAREVDDRLDDPVQKEKPAREGKGKGKGGKG